MLEIKQKLVADETGRLRKTSIRQIEVDYDDIDSVEKLVGDLKTILGSLRCKDRPSKKELKRVRFDACQRILNTDISIIYEDMVLSEERKFYVYAHCDPCFKIAIGKDGRSSFAATLGFEYMPFYIGKGTGNRFLELSRNDTHRKVRQKLQTLGVDICPKIIADGLTEKEALMYESKLIDIFGLRPNGGLLVNLDEGAKSKERRLLYLDSLKEIHSFYKETL